MYEYVLQRDRKLLFGRDIAGQNESLIFPFLLRIAIGFLYIFAIFCVSSFVCDLVCVRSFPVVLMARPFATSQHSSFWKSCAKIMDIFRKNARLRVGKQQRSLNIFWMAYIWSMMWWSAAGCVHMPRERDRERYRLCDARRIGRGEWETRMCQPIRN